MLIFVFFDATMAFLLESCTALCKSVEWYKGNYRGKDSELHVAVK